MAEPVLQQPQQLQPHHQHHYPDDVEDDEPSTTVDITSDGDCSVFDDDRKDVN